MSKLNKTLQHFWEEEKSLTILFFILVVHIFVIIPFGEHTLLGKIIFLIFYISLLSAGMFLLVKNKVLRSIFIVILAALILLASDFLFKSASFEIVDDFIVVLYCFLLSWVVLLRTFSGGPITIHRIQGAVLV